MGWAVPEAGRAYARAQELCEKMGETPDLFPVLYGLVGFHFVRGDYKTAVVHLEIVSSRLPDFADAHSLLAQAYEHLGRTDDARRELARAAALRN